MNSPRLTPGSPLLTIPCLPRPRLYLTSLLSVCLTPSLPRSLLNQTSLRLCLRGSDGEDSLQLPRPWRLLLPVTATLLTSELPRLPLPLHLPLTSPSPCRSEQTGDGHLGRTLHHPHHLGRNLHHPHHLSLTLHRHQHHHHALTLHLHHLQQHHLHPLPPHRS